MVIMSKESWDAWTSYTSVTMEINWCMREQGFLHSDMSNEEIDKGFEIQDKIIKEYFTQE